jgi:hypothetical protein
VTLLTPAQDWLRIGSVMLTLGTISGRLRRSIHNHSTAKADLGGLQILYEFYNVMWIERASGALKKLRALSLARRLIPSSVRQKLSLSKVA